MQRRALCFWILSLLVFSPVAYAGVGVDFDIHLGNQPPPPPPPPVVAPPPIILQAPPDMVYSEGLKVYVGVGIPYDLFFYNNAYFYFADGHWYRSPYYRGPWIRAGNRGIPLGLRQRRIEEIREIRRRAWDDYRGHEDRYRGRHFRAEEARERRDRQEDREGERHR